VSPNESEDQGAAEPVPDEEISALTEAGSVAGSAGAEDPETPIQDTAQTPDAYAASISPAIDETAVMISADPVTLEGAASANANSGAAAAEPEMVEVWRLQRHNREQRGAPRHARGRDQRRGPPGRPGEAGQGDQRGGEPRREGGRPGGRRSEGPQNRPQRAGEAGTAAEARGPRPDRGPRDSRPRRDERPNGERGRPDRQRGGGERSHFEDRRPERRERQPDPNSPFAALAALKAQLEGRDNGKS
jgi:ATP-dependent RNA helicase SUPV3L1/SUV3